MADNRFSQGIDAAVENTKESILGITKNSAKTSKKSSRVASVQENIETNTLSTISDDIVDNNKFTTSNSILEKVLEKNKKDKGSNHTIYLSAEVSEKLNKLIRKTKKSKSTLIDDILKEVLKEL